VLSEKYGRTFPRKSWKWLVSRTQAENVFISGSTLHYWTVKASPFDSPLPGFITVRVAFPGEAISAAGIATLKC
jgi:hypothetical protein